MRHNNNKNSLASFARRLKAGRPAGGALLLLACATAQADAFRIPYQGTAASGQGEAFAAQADDASALYYNPAGLTQLRGMHSSVGVSFVGGQTEFTSQQDGRKYYADFGGTIGFPPPSNYYLVANLGDLGVDIAALKPLTVGIGLNSPFGLATRWNGTTPFSSIITRARLPLLNIKPTMAYKINDMVSLGFGLDIYTIAGFIGAGGYESRSLQQNGLVSTELNGDGTVVGYNGSVLFTPLRSAEGKPVLNVGLVYRTGERLGLSGNYLVNGVSVAKSKSTIVLPEVVSGGLAYWPVRDRLHEWKLEYDMEFVNWSTVQNFGIGLSNGTLINVPQHWHSIYTASFGTEYKWLEAGMLPDWEIALRAGYQHSNTPIPQDTFSPQVADTDWNVVAVGLGFNCKDKGRFFGLVECGNAGNKPLTASSMGLDISFQAYIYDPRHITKNLQPSVEGVYRTSAFVGSINFNLGY